MRLAPLLFLVTCSGLLAGCAEQAAAPAAPNLLTTAETPNRPIEGVPDFVSAAAHRQRLGLLNAKGTAVFVGMAVEDVRDIFVEPPGAFERSELPPSIRDPFQAAGWQARSESFGMILYTNRLGLAVHTVEKAPVERLDEMLRTYRQRYGEAWSTLTNKHVSYWFWQSGTPESRGQELLMVCAAEVRQGQATLTEAVGSIPLMAALGMEPIAAQRDMSRAERLLRDSKSTNGAPGQNSANQPTGS